MAIAVASCKPQKAIPYSTPLSGGYMDSVTSCYAPSWRFFEDDTALGRVFDEAPYLARCSDNKTAARVRPREYALRYPYMQINRAGRVSWLIFDLDHSNAMIWKDAGLPAPNLAVRNRTNGHSHLYYAVPAVLTDEHARPRPIAYMKAIYKAYATALKADPDYNGGPVAKTPGHPWWDTSEFHSRVYDLGEMADYVKLEVAPRRKAPKEDMSHSRHCVLFDELRHFAYGIVDQERDTGSFNGFLNRLEAFAAGSNDFMRQGFSRNLLQSSLRSTVKSVARWTWETYNGSGGCRRGAMQLDKSLPLAERQTLAAKRTHEVRHKATESKIRGAVALLRAQGKKLVQATIAMIAKVTRQTVATYAHLLKEPLRSASITHIRDVKYGAHQIPAPAFDLQAVCNEPLERECAMPPDYELVRIPSAAAMAAPREEYFNDSGVTAYSCLIPFDHEHAQRIHFVSGSDGKEYGQFTSKGRALAEAGWVVRRKTLRP